jgi:hypothetical protein
MTLPRFDFSRRRRVIQLVRDLPPLALMKVRPFAALPEHAAGTQITMRRPTVNCKTPAEPQQFSTAAGAAKRVYFRSGHPYCIAKIFFRDERFDSPCHYHA